MVDCHKYVLFGPNVGLHKVYVGMQGSCRAVGYVSNFAHEVLRLLKDVSYGMSLLCSTYSNQNCAKSISPSHSHDRRTHWGYMGLYWDNGK